MTDFGRRPGDMFKSDYDPDEDGLVTAAEAHKTSHQNAGTDEIDAAGLVGRINYVNRGDPSSYDWDHTDLATDSLWHDLDCSAIVPAGAISIHFRVALRDDTVGSYMSIKQKGNTNPLNVFRANAIVAGVFTASDASVICDADRKVEILTTCLDSGQVYLVIRGWFI